MNDKIFYMFMLMFLCGIMKFCLNYKFLMINLLSLEFLMLTNFFLLYYFLIFFYLEMFFLMVFLTLSVCEGVLGISLLILMIRNYNNNYFQSLNLFKC